MAKIFIKLGFSFMHNAITIVRLNKRGKKSGCVWQPSELYRVRITMPTLSIAFLHWFATFQTQTSSTVKSDSIFQGLVYSNFLPPLFNPSIDPAWPILLLWARCCKLNSQAAILDEPKPPIRQDVSEYR